MTKTLLKAPFFGAFFSLIFVFNSYAQQIFSVDVWYPSYPQFSLQYNLEVQSSDPSDICVVLDAVMPFDLRASNDNPDIRYEAQEWNGTSSTTGDNIVCNTIGLYHRAEPLSPLPRDNQGILVFITGEITEPDPCLEGLTEACCIYQAEQSCASLGGIYSLDWSSGTGPGDESCSWVCEDDHDPDPDPDPDPPEIDLSRIESLLEQIRDRPEFDDEGIISAIENIEIPETDLDTVETILQDIADNQINSDTLSDLLSDLSVDIGDFDVAVDVDLTNLESTSFSILNLLTDLFTISNDYPDPEFINWDIAVSGVDADGNFSDSSYWQSYSTGVITGLGLDDDPDLDDLMLDELSLDDATQYQMSLPDSGCPPPRQIQLMGQDFSVDFAPFCDFFDLVGIFVVALAYFFVPFIVFGLRLGGGN